MLNDRVVCKNNAEKKQLYCSLCHTRKDNLCCQQVIKPTLLQVTRLDKHSLLNCKSVGLIYLVKCHICHLQYLGKSETAFNLQLKGNRKYSTAKKPLLLCKHFKASNQTKKLNLYKKNNETSYNKTVTTYSKKREHFWILKLKTFSPDRFHQKLNNISEKKFHDYYLSCKILYWYIFYWHLEPNQHWNSSRCHQSNICQLW